MCVSINGPGDLDLETDMRVALKVGNLPSKFGHARPLGSRIIRYVCDGRTDGWTKAMLIASFHTSGGIINKWTDGQPENIVAPPTSLAWWWWRYYKHIHITSTAIFHVNPG